MISDDITAALSFNQDTRGGTEPAGTTIELRVNADGFFETGGVGGAGQATLPLPIERIAETLVQHFDAERLRLVLDQIVLLRDLL